MARGHGRFFRTCGEIPSAPSRPSALTADFLTFASPPAALPRSRPASEFALRCASLDRALAY